MMRQTLGSSPKVFCHSRLKVLILFSLFIEDVLNCVFFRTEHLFVGFFSFHNRIHCCYLSVFWDVFWRRLLPISWSTTRHTGELLQCIKMRTNAICFHLANSLLFLLHVKRDSTPILKWLWIFSLQISISLLYCYFSWDEWFSLSQ